MNKQNITSILLAIAVLSLSGALTMLAAFFLAACSNDPEWADPEAHENTLVVMSTRASNAQKSD